jgi:hypothetical protein
MNEELRRLTMRNFIANIRRVNKSRRLRWVSYVARMEEGRSAFGI